MWAPPHPFELQPTTVAGLGSETSHDRVGDFVPRQDEDGPKPSRRLPPPGCSVLWVLHVERFDLIRHVCIIDLITRHVVMFRTVRAL